MPEILIENGTPIYSLPLTIAKIKAQQALDKAATTSGVELMIDQVGEITNEIPVDPPPPTE